MKTDHIGYLTTDISATAKAFEAFGYERQPVIDFDNQKCSVCFLVKDNNVKIELVKPYEENKSLLRLMKKTGNAPYHICYEVDNLDEMLEKLTFGGQFVQMFPPVPAPAFGGCRICYLWSQETGLVELVESPQNISK